MTKAADVRWDDRDHNDCSAVSSSYAPPKSHLLAQIGRLRAEAQTCRRIAPMISLRVEAERLMQMASDAERQAKTLEARLSDED